MKKFLNNFAGATVLSPEEQISVKGGGFEKSTCGGGTMPCGNNNDCPYGCECNPNEYGWRYCEDKKEI